MSVPTAGGRPDPVSYRGMAIQVDSDWAGYFEATRSGRLALQRCGDCGRLRYPPGAGCPGCGGGATTWTEVSGRGTIYSYAIVVQAIQPGFRDWAPYPLVVVELDEQRGVPGPDDGLRLVANLLTPDLRPEPEERVAIGARVQVLFQDVGGLVLPQFRLAGDGGGTLWRLPA
jgi:hypothetical protein